ncbi:MAG: cytochrome b N-terminal domain-containing protein [Myxococcales bacterium]
MPGGARFAYAFGSVLVVLLALQAATGLALAFVYSPSTAGAWASLAFLTREVPAGALVRGLHRWGASALVVVLGLHLLQTALFGAYRPPRRATWWSGLALGGLLLAFALTGYLLPWDQRGYWATRVATDIVGGQPLAGPWLRRLLQGGNGLGNLTLTRFYAIHVLVLPWTAAALLGFHLLAFRRHGVTPHWRVAQDAAAGHFWPDQLWRDAVLAFAAVLVVFLAARQGVPLGAPADPTAHVEPRPEWYFLPLFELLRVVRGPHAVWLASLVPALAASFLAALPLLDRGEDRSPARRWRPLAALALLGLAAIGLGARSVLDDRRDPHVLAAERRDQAQAQRVLALAAGGVPPEGPLALLRADPVERGRAIFERRCAGCHAPDPPAPSKGPSLAGFLSPAWIEGLLRDPDAAAYYGHTKAAKGMDGYASMDPVELAQLASFLASLGTHDVPPAALPAALQPGAAAFAAAGCDACHSVTAGEAMPGPNLAGYGGDRWLAGLLDDPGGPLAYGETNGMPSFRGKLAPEDRAALFAYLHSLKADEPLPR